MGSTDVANDSPTPESYLFNIAGRNVLQASGRIKMQSPGPEFWFELCEEHETKDGLDQPLTDVLRDVPQSTWLVMEKPLRAVTLRGLDLAC